MLFVKNFHASGGFRFDSPRNALELGSDVGQRLGSIWALRTSISINVPTDLVPDSLVLAGNVCHGRCCKLLGCKAAPGLESTKKKHQQSGDSQVNLDDFNFISTNRK